MNLKVQEQLNKDSLNIYYDTFNKINNSNWTLEQFEQSLANQDYLKHLVFYENNEIVGITEYSITNPWNKTMLDTIYAKADKIKKIYN